mmetsp:Transcript_41411/g.127663  ORF Transcript_41411/g.127663 Transcript_41411/m.127663 type:complete len:242 (-) Transcript_41411:1174-1899(-)
MRREMWSLAAHPKPSAQLYGTLGREPRRPGMASPRRGGGGACAQRPLARSERLAPLEPARRRRRGLVLRRGRGRRRHRLRWRRRCRSRRRGRGGGRVVCAECCRRELLWRSSEDVLGRLLGLARLDQLDGGLRLQPVEHHLALHLRLDPRPRLRLFKLLAALHRLRLHAHELVLDRIARDAEALLARNLLEGEVRLDLDRRHRRRHLQVTRIVLLGDQLLDLLLARAALLRVGEHAREAVL